MGKVLGNTMKYLHTFRRWESDRWDKLVWKPLNDFIDDGMNIVDDGINWYAPLYKIIVQFVQAGLFLFVVLCTGLCLVVIPAFFILPPALFLYLLVRVPFFFVQIPLWNGKDCYYNRR